MCKQTGGTDKVVVGDDGEVVVAGDNSEPEVGEPIPDLMEEAMKFQKKMRELGAKD